MSDEDNGLEAVWEALRGVQDPEFPIDVVAFGLVKGVDVAEGRATIHLTYTSMGCPWTEWIEGDVKEAVAALEHIDDVQIVVDWSEPWSISDILEGARERLAQVGIA